MAFANNNLNSFLSYQNCTTYISRYLINVMLSQCFDKGIGQKTGDKHFFIMSATEIAPTMNPETPQHKLTVAYTM